MPTTGQYTMTGKAKVIGTFSIMVGDVDICSDQPTRLYVGSGASGLSANSSFSMPQGQRGTANVQLILGPYDPFTAPNGTPVYAFAFGVRFYAGLVATSKINWIGEDGWHGLMLSCISLEQWFDRICCWPPSAYTNMTCGAIVAALFNKYCAGLPITLDDIEPGPVSQPLALAGDRLSDVLNSLATTAGFVWDVDPTMLMLRFHAQGAVPAPWDMLITDVLWETAEWDSASTDYRNRQVTRMSFDQNLPSNALFPGDGGTKIFTFPYIPASIISAADTTSTQAICTCTFTGVPADGDYTVIGTALVAIRYAFVVTLDNTQAYQVLVGATAAASAQNLADAINAKPDKAGITFSLPTLEHGTLNAGTLTGSAFPCLTKVPGTGGVLVQVTSSAAFSWGTATDGSDGTTGTAMTAGKDFVWPVVG